MKRYLLAAGVFLVVVLAVTSRTSDTPPTPKKSPPLANAKHRLATPRTDVTVPQPRSEPPKPPVAASSRKPGSAAPTGGTIPPSPLPPPGFAGPMAGRLPRTPPPSHGVPVFPWHEREARLNQKLNDRDLNDALKKAGPNNLQPYLGAAVPLIYPGTGSIGRSSGASGGPATGIGGGGAGGVVAGLPAAGPGSGGGGASAPPQPPPAVPPQLAPLLGRFEGTIRPDNGDRPWQLMVSLSGKAEEGKLRGEFTVELSRDGQLINRSTQNGELTGIKKPDDNSDGVELRVNEQYYYYLYYKRDRDALVGRFYERVDTGVVQAMGNIVLPRRS